MSGLLATNPWDALKTTWPLVATAAVIALIGTLTMHPFDGSPSLAPRQLIFIALGVGVFATCAALDLRFMRRGPVIITTYALALVLLVLVLIIGDRIMGARSWFDLGFFAFQPADFAKLAIIALLAKYFSRRHVVIGDFRHVLISGAYAAVPILLILVQPDLGTAVILMTVWFGMILVSGIKVRHLALVGTLGLIAATGLWFFGLQDHQRERLTTFVNPAADITGAGYNAYQAMVASGSGQLFGKDIGYGTQSKLRFLPEYQTDFIFAAYAEEWGFVGVVLLLSLYAYLLYQLLTIARRAATNFDALFTIGVLVLFLAHIGFHAGINLGLLPVTGTTIPFMSSGGSHVIVEFAALGIIASLARHGRTVPRDRAVQEYEG